MNKSIEPRESFEFPKGSKSTTISLTELKQSRQVTDGRGQPFKNRPKQFWEIIEELSSILDKKGLVYDIEPIHVQQSVSHKSFSGDERAREGFDPKAPAPFSNWVFEKLITRIVIPDEKSDLQGTIAIAFNSKGIQIATGMDYKICSNLCILGGSGTVFTTGTASYSESHSYHDMIEEIRSWIESYDQNMIVQKNAARAMLKTNIKGAFIHEMIGRLYWKSVENAKKSERIVAFLSDEMNMFVQKFMDIVEERIGKGTLDHDFHIPVWDIYNIGTDVLKAENKVDLAAIIPAIKIWGEFLMENYVKEFYKIDVQAVEDNSNVNDEQKTENNE